MKGWIDEVDGGVVYGRVIIDGDEFAFWVRLLDVMESQRVDLRPDSYITMLNGELAVESVLYTTHEIEEADAEADELWNAIFGDGHRSAPDSSGVRTLEGKS